MRIECPQCGAGGDVDLARRPPNANTLKCPRCQTRIPLPEEEKESALPSMGSLSPEIAPQTEAASSPAAPSGLSLEPRPVPRAACALCHQSFPRTEMVRFGLEWVCADCKPTYVDMIALMTGACVL